MRCLRKLALLLDIQAYSRSIAVVAKHVKSRLLPYRRRMTLLSLCVRLTAHDLCSWTLFIFLAYTNMNRARADEQGAIRAPSSPTNRIAKI